MAQRKASATWTGNLKEGTGRMKFGGGAFDGAYSFESRFEEGEGTNPEELIGAAHAGCFSMALSGQLTESGHEPKRVSTEAHVSLAKAGGGFEIDRIRLVTEAEVPGISDEQFQKLAEQAKEGCPVSKALAGPEITLEAKLL